MIPHPAAQVAGKVAGVLGKLRAEGDSVEDALEAVAEIAARDRRALPIVAGLAARSVIKNRGATMSPAQRQQVAKTMTRAAKTLVASGGPKAIRALPKITRSVKRTAGARGTPAAVAAEGRRATAAKVAQNPALLRRLSAPSPRGQALVRARRSAAWVGRHRRVAHHQRPRSRHDHHQRRLTSAPRQAATSDEGQSHGTRSSTCGATHRRSPISSRSRLRTLASRARQLVALDARRTSACVPIDRALCPARRSTSPPPTAASPPSTATSSGDFAELSGSARLHRTTTGSSRWRWSSARSTGRGVPSACSSRCSRNAAPLSRRALAAHDAIARDCYAAVRAAAPTIFPGPLVPPLTYLEHGYSPATMRRGVTLSRLLGETNPFPLIRIPYDRDRPWQAVFLHEVAHNLQADSGCGWRTATRSSSASPRCSSRRWPSASSAAGTRRFSPIWRRCCWAGRRPPGAWRCSCPIRPTRS